MKQPDKPIGKALLVISGLLLCLLAIGRCEPQPSPLEPRAPQLTPQPSASPTSPPVAQAGATQTVEFVSRRKRPLPPASASVSQEEFEDEIRVVVHQAASTSAPVIVVTPAPTPHVYPAGPRLGLDGAAPVHSRLGVVVGPFPGVAALDVQLVRGRPLEAIDRFEIFPEALRSIELSLDAEVNHLQAGLLVTGGSKVFAGAGYYATYTLFTGPTVVVGMRF